MTVKDLIEHLSKMPQDLVVVYGFHSETAILDADEVIVDGNYFMRNGQYIAYEDWCWDKTEGEPKLVSVCLFPGN